MANGHTAELVKVAVLGLQNSQSYDEYLTPSIQALLATKQYENEVQRFLDAASLQVLQDELSRVPVPDQFEELPPIPEETRACLNDLQQVALQRFLLEGKGVRIIWHLCFDLLQRYGFALSEHILIPLLEREAMDKTSKTYFHALLSQRGRWIVQMNNLWREQLNEEFELWQSLHSAEDLPTQAACFLAMSSPLQLRYLSSASDSLSIAFVQAVWDKSSALIRLQLWPHVHGALTTDSTLLTWCYDKRLDKSLAVQRELLRVLVYQQEALELVQQAQLQLALCIEKSARKIDLLPPETLTPELKALGISEQDAFSRGAAKAVIRLGQLISLVGPDGWGLLLNTTPKEALIQLAKSRFKDELEPYLLEAVLYYQEATLLGDWCQLYTKDTQAQQLMAVILPRLGRPALFRVIEVLYAHERVDLLFSSQLWRDLIKLGHYLRADLALPFMQGWITKRLQRRYSLDAQDAITLAAWLELDVKALEQLPLWMELKQQNIAEMTDIQRFEEFCRFKFELMQAASTSVNSVTPPLENQHE